MDSRRSGALLPVLCLCLCASSAAALSPQEELAAVKSELAATKAELASTQDTLSRLVERMDAVEERSVASAELPSGPRIPPVNADNPAVSFVVDTTLSAQRHESGWNFALQSGELFISAPIDPFLRGYTAIVGSSEEGFDIEEAALITTSLPWNLTVKGGRFFADVGRFPHWHVEQLPFVDRPPSIERLIPGEAGAQGAEVTWLAPTEHYLEVTAGLYDSIGAERGEEIPDAFGSYRSFEELTMLVHPATYFDLSDTLNLELGGTLATIPKGGTRYLYGFDATLRHQPGTSRFYQGAVLAGEWYWNDENFRDVEIGTDPDGEPILDSGRFQRNGGYAYLEGFFGRQYSLGFRSDFAQNPFGPKGRQQTYSAFATWFPSEFQRLRLQGDQIVANGPDDQRLTLQWTAFLGSHTHGFATR